MNLPFSRHDFFEVFARYNQAVWPAQLALVILAALAVFAILRSGRQRDRIVAGVLAALWLWSGLVYHWLFFADVNRIAVAFGVLFLAQAVALFQWGVRRPTVIFKPDLSRSRVIVGSIIIMYALVIYPLLTIALGQLWPHAPTFGAPCPVVLFTLGLLLWTDASLPKPLLIVPLTWALIATSAAIEFGVHEDWGLTVSAVATAALLLPRRRTKTPRRPHGIGTDDLSHRIWKRVWSG